MLGWYGGGDVGGFGGLTGVLPCGSSPGANDTTIVLDLSWWYSLLSRSAAASWGTEFCSKKISNMYNCIQCTCMWENTAQKHKIRSNWTREATVYFIISPYIFKARF